MLQQTTNKLTYSKLPTALAYYSRQAHWGDDTTRIALETFHPYVADADFLGTIRQQVLDKRPLSEVPHGVEVEDGLKRMAAVLSEVLRDPGAYEVSPVLFFDDTAAVADRPGQMAPSTKNVEHARIIADGLGHGELADLLGSSSVFAETESYYLNPGYRAIADVEKCVANYEGLRVTPNLSLIDCTQSPTTNLYRIRLSGKDGRPIPSCDIMDGLRQQSLLMDPLLVSVVYLPESYPPQQERALRLASVLGAGRSLRCVRAYYDQQGIVRSIDQWSDDERTSAVAELIANAAGYDGEISLKHMPQPQRRQQVMLQMA